MISDLIRIDNYTFNIHSVPVALIGFLMLSTGFFVFVRNSKHKTNISFLLVCLSVTIWLFATAIGMLSNKESLAQFWFKIDNFGVMFISISVYYFICSFLDLRKYTIIKIGYITAFVLGILAVFTNLLVVGVKKHFWGYFPLWGILAYPALAFFFGFMMASFIHLVLEYKKKTSALERNRIKYLFIAFLVAYTGSVDYLPTFGIEIYPFGYISIAVFLSIVAHTIVKYRLLDIRVAITRATVFLVVYTAVLGMPFCIGYQTKLWFLSTLFGVLLATLGPFIYNSLRKKAEGILLRDEKTYQRHLERLSDKIAFMRNKNEIASLIVNDCLDNVKLTYTSLYFYDEINHEYRIVKSRGRPNNSISEIISADDALVKALENKREILVADELQHNSSANNNHANNEQVLKTMQEINASLVAPCFTAKGLIGFICFGEKSSKRHFTEDDLTTFSILANKTAIGIENDLYDKKRYEETQKEAVTDLAQNAAHQFQNNITKTYSTAELIWLSLKKINFDTMSPQDAKAYIKNCMDKFEAILQVAKDGANIVKSIIDKKSAKEEFKSVNLHNAAESAIKSSNAEKQKDILEQEDMLAPAILNQIPQNSPDIFANQALLENAFLNLINNACDACIGKHRFIKKGALPEYKGELPYKPKITISLKDFESTVLIKVEDNGLGMKEEAFRRLFVPFSSTKGSGKGHGISLSVVREIVEKDHKGKISAQTQYGEGTTFTMELPKKMKG